MKQNDTKNDFHVVIIGCGRLGSGIANTLSNKNKYVTVIDNNKDSFRKLSPSFGGLTLEGNGMDIEVLKESGANKANVLIASTDNDNVNILIAQIAKEVFNVKEVIARLYDPEKECVYKEYHIHSIFPALLSKNEAERILDIGGGPL